MEGSSLLTPPTSCPRHTEPQVAPGPGLGAHRLLPLTRQDPGARTSVVATPVSSWAQEPVEGEGVGRKQG